MWLELVTTSKINHRPQYTRTFYGRHMSNTFYFLQPPSKKKKESIILNHKVLHLLSTICFQDLKNLPEPFMHTHVLQTLENVLEPLLTLQQNETYQKYVHITIPSQLKNKQTFNMDSQRKAFDPNLSREKVSHLCW